MCSFIPSQALNRSGVQARAHSQPGAEAAASDPAGRRRGHASHSLSLGSFLLGTQAPRASALTLPTDRGTYATIAGRDRDPFFRAVSVIQHVYLIFCRQGCPGHCWG